MTVCVAAVTVTKDPGLVCVTVIVFWGSSPLAFAYVTKDYDVQGSKRFGHKVIESQQGPSLYETRDFHGAHTP